VLLLSAAESLCLGIRGVGDLVLVYKRVTTLAGYTSRVSELLETVDRLSRADDSQTRELYLRNVSSSDTLSSYMRVPEAKRILGDIIKFHKCAACLAMMVTTFGRAHPNF
jgi:ATP-binding cassette, subfamily D (ALD), member 3